MLPKVSPVYNYNSAMINDIPLYVEATTSPMFYLPELAAKVGPRRAVILQQFHWLLRDNHNGRTIKWRAGRWLYNSYAAWGKQFQLPEWKMKEELRWLEKEKYIRSEQPEGWNSRRKSYQLLIGATAPSPEEIARENTHGSESTAMDESESPPMKGSQSTPFRSITINTHKKDNKNRCLTAEPIRISKGQKPLPLASCSAVIVTQQKTVDRSAVEFAGHERAEKISQFELQKAWERLMKEWYPEVKMPLVGKDILILRVHLKKLSAVGIPMLPYVEWVLARWDGIMLHKFPRMKAKPDYPQPRFLVRFFDVFVSAWQEQAKIEKGMEMSWEERQDKRSKRIGENVPPAPKSPANQAPRTLRPLPVHHVTPVRPLPTKAPAMPPIKHRANVEGSFGKWTEEDHKSRAGKRRKE